jgi:hypothetical protein
MEGQCPKPLDEEKKKQEIEQNSKAKAREG